MQGRPTISVGLKRTLKWGVFSKLSLYIYIYVSVYNIKHLGPMVVVSFSNI